MALQLILGSSGAGKSHYLYETMIHSALEQKDCIHYVIVPEQFTMSTQKDFVTMHPNHGIMNIDILSFMRLAYRVLDEVGKEEKPVLEDTGKTIILRKILEMKKDKLVYFKGNIKRPGFVDEVKSFLSELYQYSLKEEDLESMLESVSPNSILHKKIQDIITIYDGFREYLKEKYITTEELMDVLYEALEHSNKIKNSVICFDGFTGFTPCQYQVLEKLMEYAKDIYITVTIDEREDISRIGKPFWLFYLSKRTIRKLYELADNKKVEIKLPVYPQKENGVLYRFRESEALAALEHNLFRYPPKTYEKPQEDITIHSLRDPRSEVSYVIKEILHLVREEGYRYRDIAVVSGDVEGYGRILEGELIRVSIPCFIDSKRAIMSNPYVKCLDSLLEMMIRNFDYESVFHYLRSGMTGLEWEDIDKLENYVLAAGIRGLKRYSKPFEKLLRSMEEEDLVKINVIREQFFKTIEAAALALKGGKKTILAITKALYHFTLEQNIFEKLNLYEKRFEKENDLLSAKEYGQIYTSVMEIFERLTELMGDEVVSLKEYRELLLTGFREVEVGLIPAGVDQIVVGDIERTRLKDIKVLFLLGANDGIIPKSGDTGGLLSDIERELLKNADVEMAPTKRENIYTEQFYLYLNMTKPQNRLYITYSNISSDGKKRKQSYLIGKICSLFPNIEIKDEKEADFTIERVLGTDKGRTFLLEGIRKYGKEDFLSGEKEVWKQLYSWYCKREELNPMLLSYVNEALCRPRNSQISKAVAKVLYGNPMVGSVTRLEQYAACAYAHFLSYGLKLKEREEFKLTMPDLGTIFHTVLELYSNELKERKLGWNDISDEEREILVSQCVTKVTEEYGNTILKSNQRNEYVIRRIERIAKRTLWALTKQVSKGDFIPKGYEMKFSFMEDLDATHISLSDGSVMGLTGRIDRLDTFEEEQDIYVKIVDYKSGKKVFRILDVYYGLEMQLIVYLDAAMEQVQKNNPHKEVTPAGIFYYGIDDPIVDKASKEQVEQNILKELRVNGLVNDEETVICHMDKDFVGENGIAACVKSNVIPVETLKSGGFSKNSSVAGKEQFQNMVRYVRNLMSQFGDEIVSGKTEINPFKKGDKTACDYCSYRGICQFDARWSGHKYRELEELEEKEVWRQLNGEGRMDEGTKKGN